MDSQVNSMATKVAVSSSSQLAADAGASVAAAGGNAVDAAIAAVLVQMTTEPGMVSLAGGAYVALNTPGKPPVAIDGGVEMPGQGLERQHFGRAGVPVSMAYGGGTQTMAGYGSIGTPGALAALSQASQRYGALPWKALLRPAIEIADSGFGMPVTAHSYLQYSHRDIFGLTQDSFAAIHDSSGEIIAPGEIVRIPGLRRSLEAIAAQGADEFFRGRLARELVEEIEQHGGILTKRDMASYQARETPALGFSAGPWQFGTQPPPSIGGATLGAMASLLEQQTWVGRGAEEVARLAQIQAEVLGYRHLHLDQAENLPRETERLLELAYAGAGLLQHQSASTVHTSAVDNAGCACAVTASSGYGSGVMPAGTGIWMNNCLGEMELNRRGFHALPPGERLPSNMAPTVGTHSTGAVLALGSPGADRITTALAQFILNFAHLEMGLQAAIDAPRIHVEFPDQKRRVASEPGLPLDHLDMPVRQLDQPSMFFGGVSGALFEAGRLSVASDPRRVGGTAIAEVTSR